VGIAKAVEAMKTRIIDANCILGRQVVKRREGDWKLVLQSLELGVRKTTRVRFEILMYSGYIRF
jgi:hypothetical protein